MSKTLACETGGGKEKKEKEKKKKKEKMEKITTRES